MTIDFDSEFYTEKVCALDFDLNYKPALRVRIFNQWSHADINSFSFLLSEILGNYFSIEETHDSNYQIAIDGPFGNQKIDNPEAFKIFFTGEPRKLKTKGYDLSLGFDYLNEDNYIRYPLYYKRFTYNISSNYNKEGECNPSKEYFACFLVGNAKGGDGAIARTDFFHELSKYKFVASGGKHLNNLGYVVPKNETFSFLSKCKFNIAFENNLQYKGYMTEKLFQAYLAGSIPIYSSHPEAQKEVNKKAFISQQDFLNNQEMIEYIKQLDQDDYKYCEMWNQKLITNPDMDYTKLQDKLKDFLVHKFIEPFKAKLEKACIANKK